MAVVCILQWKALGLFVSLNKLLPLLGSALFSSLVTIHSLLFSSNNVPKFDIYYHIPVHVSIIFLAQVYSFFIFLSLYKISLYRAKKLAFSFNLRFWVLY